MEETFSAGSVEGARAMLEKERAARTQECANKIGAMLKELRCQLATQISIVDGRIVANVIIEAQP